MLVLIVLIFWAGRALYAAPASAQQKSPQTTAHTDPHGQDEPAPTCASCHAPLADPQPQSGMGRALLPPNANPTLNQHPALTFSRGAYTYSIQTHGGQSTYSVTDGSRTLSAPVLWSFGANNQTWMLALNGKMYESLVSYYPVVHGLAITTGDDRIEPATLEQALGRELSSIDVKTCFGCHATNTAILNVAGGRASQITSGAALATGSIPGVPNLKTLQPGVTCEHCHLGAAAHLLDAANGRFESTPPSLGKLTSEDLSNFCGKCHRTWDMVVRSHWRGEMNVRFQPYRLANSACYNGADARIGCTACHNPHEDVVRDAAFYDRKCLACHTNGGSATAASLTMHPDGPGLRTVALDGPAKQLQATPGALVAEPGAKSCPVAKSNCTTCHMPKVILPSSGGHLTFTDHQIRVVRAGDAYPN